MAEEHTIKDARAHGFSSLELYELWHWATCFPTATFSDHVIKAANAVEKEIKERFTELPVDSKGIPIKVGDWLTDGEYTFVVDYIEFHDARCTIFDENGVAWACCDVEHVPDWKKQMRPCPFCGSNDLYITEIMINPEAPFMSADDKTIGVFCNTCKQTVILEDNEDEGRSASTEQKAVEAWNRRVGSK